MDRTLFILRKSFITTTQVFAGLICGFVVLLIIAEFYELASGKKTYWKLIFEIIVFILLIAYLFTFAKEMGVSFNG